MYVKYCKEIRQEVAEQRHKTRDEKAKARIEVAKRTAGTRILPHTTRDGQKVDIVDAQVWTLKKGLATHPVPVIPQTFAEQVGLQPTRIRSDGTLDADSATRNRMWDALGKGSRLTKGPVGLSAMPGTLVGAVDPKGSKALDKGKRGTKKNTGHTVIKDNKTSKSPVASSAPSPAGKGVAQASNSPTNRKVEAGRSFASVVKQLVPPKQAAQEQIARAAIRSLRLEKKFNSSVKLAGFVATWARTGTLVLKSAHEVGQPRTLVFPRKRLGLDGNKSNPAAAKAVPAPPAITSTAAS